MTNLSLKLIGNIALEVDGKPQALPPSKKTRALLAYLGLNPRSFSREFLCELLWEVPDDPRGSLRWSLSKLRKLVDGKQAPRIIANRNSVSLASDDIEIDVRQLDSFSAQLASTGVEELMDATSRFQGNFLEGVDFSNFHTFHAWCVSERERITQLQIDILHALVERLSNTPESALPYARQLVSYAPYDEEARALLISMLTRLGKSEEAEQQYNLGLRLLREIGQESSDILLQARRNSPSSTPITPVTAKVAPTLSNSPELVGRKTELERLQNHLEHPTPAPVFYVQGAIGIGKSRMLQALAEYAAGEGHHVLQAQAFESEAMRPFAVWADALAEITNIFNQEDSTNRDRLFSDLGHCLAELSRNKPVLLLLDDMQWCDESSAAALHYVARSSRHLPISIVTALRSRELRDNAALQRTQRDMHREGLSQSLNLGPLKDAQIRQILLKQFPELTAEPIAQRCQGNPLFALELARAEDSGEISTLAELIHTRLVSFSLDEEQILQWAAVMASGISIERLAAMTGADHFAVAEAMQKAEDQAIVESTHTGYQFSHDLLAKGIYADIPPARRKVMHRRIAEAMEQPVSMALDDASDRAFHATQSGDALLAARALVTAGKLCLRYFANDDALSLSRRGLLMVDELPIKERIELSIELNEIMMSAAPVEDWETAADNYVRLAEQALDNGSMAHARIGYYMASFQRWSHGHWNDAREETLQAERVARGANDEQHVIGLAEAAKCLAMIERDLSQADAMLMEAQALSSRQNINHPAICTGAGILRFHENKLVEATDYFREARTLCRMAGDRISEFQALEYLAMIDIEMGDLRAAKATSATLRTLGERIRQGSEGPFSRALHEYCRYADNTNDDALDMALQELRIADAKHRLAYLLNRAALVDIDRARNNRAIERADEALECARLLQRDSETLMARTVLLLAGHEHADNTREIQALLNKPVAVWARKRAEQAMTGATRKESLQ